MIGDLGQHLIFIISQPRSGSTLLQRMLASHPDIHSTPEPWIALYPLYGLRPPSLETEYGAEVAWYISQKFISELPDGREIYLQGVRSLLIDLYNQALKSTGKRFFVDKSTRYHMIIPELIEVFPQATYIFLFRNPLAVLVSILTTWTKGEWLGIANAKVDLLSGPANMVAGLKLVGERGFKIHYESLTEQPETALRAICKHGNLEFSNDMIDYGNAPLPPWDIGDQTKLYRYHRPETEPIHKWKDALHEPQIWRLANDYLHILGDAMVGELAYSSRELEEVLANSRPGIISRLLTFKFQWLIKNPPKNRKWWEQRLVWLARRLLHR